MYNILLKTNYIFQNKILERRVSLFYIFANLFNFWLNRRQLDSQSMFHLLLYTSLVKVFEEKSGFKQSEVKKGNYF